jgi:hypothetical protein
MAKFSERALRAGRAAALENGADLIHVLGCPECELRAEALFTLSLLGWDEESFLRDHLAYLLGAIHDRR